MRYNAGAAKLWRILGVLTLLSVLSACGGSRVRLDRETSSSAIKGATTSPVANDGTPRRGGYYQDDGPGDNPPPNLELIADAEPRIEPLARAANRPYEVFGKQYVPDVREVPFRQRGVASWYGRKFHGQRTSSGEIYDMYAMTAAHPTLPIPSYVRVTNPANGKTVIVRVNDRGPFHSDRIMDLSYTAAFKLGYANRGSTLVEVERILPAEIAQKKTEPAPAVTPVVSSVPIALPDNGSAVVNSSTAPGTVATTATESRTSPSADSGTGSTLLSGIFIQLGAFGAREKAEMQRAEIYQQFGWMNEVIHIELRDNLHRLLAGPYATREAAATVVQRLGVNSQIKTLIVTR